MTPEQANNLRILADHMDGVKRTLDMERYFSDACGTPACALGEACTIPVLGLHVLDRLYPTNTNEVFGLELEDRQRLFGSSDKNIWKREQVTPQEWTAEARKVLAENGYAPKSDPFPAFLARILEPIKTPVCTE